MRTNLKVLRVKNNLSQQAAADSLGVSRETYVSVENGKRDGSLKLWFSIQNVFNVPGAEMWELMQNDETEPKKNRCCPSAS